MVWMAALAAFQVVKGYHDAQTIREQAALKEQIDNMNAEDAELDAFKAEQYGYTESARYQSVVDQTVAGQRGAYAANNVDVNYGTAADRQDETKLTGYFNMLEMQRRGKERAMAYRRESRQIRLGAKFGVQQGNIDAAAAQTAGIMDAAKTGVSGYDRMGYGRTKTTSGSDYVKDAEISRPGNPQRLSSDIASYQYRRGNLAYDTTGIA